MRKSFVCLAILFALCLVFWPQGASSQGKQQVIPRKPLVFKFKAALVGIKGEYSRDVDVLKNSSFYIKDQAGLYQWMIAGKLSGTQNDLIQVQLWLSWTLPGMKAEGVESSFTLKIGDKPKLVPESIKALEAYASIEKTGAELEEQGKTYLDHKHPAWLVIESYITSLKTNDYKLFQACFLPKTETGLANISKSLLTNYRDKYLQKYKNVDVNAIKILVLSKTETSFDYSVLTANDEVIDVPHLKKGTFINTRATTWKINW